MKIYDFVFKPTKLMQKAEKNKLTLMKVPGHKEMGKQIGLSKREPIPLPLFQKPSEKSQMTD